MQSLFDSSPPNETYGVSRFVSYIDRLLRANKKLQNISVKGEVTNFRVLPSGHHSFDLKEGSDVLACILWTSNLPGLPPIKDGDEIVAVGDIGVYRIVSKYQLQVTSLQFSGVGQLYAQLAALREKFRKEGLFESQRKRVMRDFPVRLAVVSAKGKGAEDFLKTIASDAPHLDVQFVETRVQGSGAEIDIAEAIDKASRLDVDAIVVTRGGGSFEDLFPFNLEPVVRAIVRARHPVLTAIAHTGDHHLADDVADYTFTTPTRAAEHFVKIRTRWLARAGELDAALLRAARNLVLAKSAGIEQAARRGANALQSRIASARTAVANLVERLNEHTPVMRVAARRARWKDADARLDAAMRALLRSEYAPRLGDAQRGLTALHARVLTAARLKIERLEHRLQLSDPHDQLTGGRALLTGPDGKPITSSADVRVGDLISAQLQHGTLAARVERTAADG